MPANPERMRPTPLSIHEVVVWCNSVVKAEAEKIVQEPNIGQAKYARQFLFGIVKPNAIE